MDGEHLAYVFAESVAVYAEEKRWIGCRQANKSSWEAMLLARCVG
ncbi:MAG: hypothetical protein SPI30_01040 [Prevotella sp.]|nr:hypothetical protein [Prevotella sp.]